VIVIGNAFSVNRFLPLGLLSGPSASIRFRAVVQACDSRQKDAETLRRWSSGGRDCCKGWLPTVNSSASGPPGTEDQRLEKDPGLWVQQAILLVFLVFRKFADLGTVRHLFAPIIREQ